MSNPDQIQRFLFDDGDVRGVLVGLDESYRQVLSRHPYPPAVARLLGEMLAAVSLLGSTLKFEGRLALQAKGGGALSLLLAECNHRRQIRGIARWQGEVPSTGSFGELLADGQVALTIEPEHGKRYQGIVPLEQASLAGCLEEYFARSEQLPTRIQLQAGNDGAAGMLLQVLPGEGATASTEDWERITHLGATLSPEELVELDNQTLLYRLYHEERVRLFDPEPLSFACDCSLERSARALKTLGRGELQTLLQQQSYIHIDCQFCHQRYRFDAADVARLFSETAHAPSSGELH